MARDVPDFTPKYTVPSLPSAGVWSTMPPGKFHRIFAAVPSGVVWTAERPFVEPTYTVPSDPITGDEVILVPILTFQIRVVEVPFSRNLWSHPLTSPR